MTIEQEMMQSALIQSGEDFLAHYGKKGMKWGIKSVGSRIATRNTTMEQNRINRLKRVSSGKGKKGERTKAALMNVSLLDLARGGGLKGASKIALKRKKKAVTRLNKLTRGNKTTQNILTGLYGVRFRDLKF